MFRNVLILLISVINFATAYAGGHVIYQGPINPDAMMHIDPESSASIDFMLPSSKHHAAKHQKLRPHEPKSSHIDTHIAALHGRLDTLTKAITDLAKPKKATEVPAVPKATAKPVVPRHKAAPLHASHPFVDSKAKHLAPLSPPPPPMHMPPHHMARMMQHQKMMSANKHPRDPRIKRGRGKHAMRMGHKMKEIHMRKVADLVRSIRKDACPANPGGSFEVTLGVHPKTGNLAVINAENGFVVNIKCKNPQKPKKCKKNLVNRKNNNRVQSSMMNSKQVQKPIVHDKVRVSLRSRPKPKRTLKVRQPQHNKHVDNIAEDLNLHESPFDHERETMAKRITSKLTVQPHRVIIQRASEHEGINLSLPDIINPPKPMNRPIG